MSAALYQPHCFCLALACHHTETLPPATAAVKRSDTLDIQILAGVFFPSNPSLFIQFVYIIQLHGVYLL